MSTNGPEVRLVADAMLGRLARWLRALGYDTLYDAAMDDDALARLARAEGRVLLTRDHGLAGRRGVTVLLVESDRLDDQLVQVGAALPAPAVGAFGRCVACNALLDEVNRASVEGRVPEYVWENHDEFALCRQCGRVYWAGSHHQAMVRRFGRLSNGAPPRSGGVS